LLTAANDKPKVSVDLNAGVDHRFVIALPEKIEDSAEWERKWGHRDLEAEPVPPPPKARPQPPNAYTEPVFPAGGYTPGAPHPAAGAPYTPPRPPGHSLEPSCWPQAPMPVPGNFVRPSGNRDAAAANSFEAFSGAPRIKAAPGGRI
jgi:hypothetical protein